ncbi:ABC transporter ATP-binding protein [Halosolutus gelatinilyticus]|uniref:ABC transporter ATP-binding protein n=1 Tax=Halosolutus gelatinilyticus TaxID=2931975 RepID=UPI001FF2AD83|nr:ABC transporter ATP-binding protein [Halosolutus gelatinilyticus]
MDRVTSSFDSNPGGTTEAAAGPNQSQNTVLETSGLTKEFDSLLAVNDVNFALESQEIHGLIGPNGAGKTTLVNLITGKLQPTDGTIEFKGEDIAGLSPSEIGRRGIGRSFQVVQYFPEMTVRKHFHLAVRDPTRTITSVFDRSTDHTDRIEEIAERVHLTDRLDDVAKDLSHGEKRFLDIGLVLGLDADVILFDEPAAGLNTAESEELMEIIREIRDEYTILIIEHDVELVRRLADRITVLHDGETLATGTPDEIVTNARVKEVYLGE